MAKAIKYTQSLMNGFNTSATGAVGHSRAAIRINQALDAFSALNADTTRTRTEKAPMYKRLKEQHGEVIRKNVNRFGEELVARADAHAAAVDKVMKSVSMVEAIQMVAALKAANLSPDAMISVLNSSPEMAVAFAVAPKEIHGFAKDTTERAVMKFHPELLEQKDELQRDYAAFEALDRKAELVIKEIGYNVDEQALASRFDESSLSPKPDAVTAAQQNSESAE